MKIQHVVSTVLMAFLAMPLLADAQIYKWKDKNGVTRYSDTPPIGVKANPIGKESAAKPIQPPKQEAPAATPNAVNAKPKGEGVEDPPPDPEMEAERVRAQNEESERQKKEQEAKQAEANAENCKTARTNYNTYSQGGRVYKATENGERVYMSEAELKVGKKRERANIKKYCK